MKTLVSVITAALTMTAVNLPVQAQTMTTSPAASPAPAASGAMQAGGMVTLVPANKKGQGGSAVLSQSGNDLTIALEVPQGYTAGAQAVIVSGTCSGQSAMMKGKAAYRLQAPTSGSSKTTLKNLSVEKLTSSPYAIVVQGTPQLCGDVTNLLPPQKP
jgi:hypothetical protein